MERYRYYKNMSGKDVAAFFDKYKVNDYILRYFEFLHTMGDDYIIKDIDEYIANSGC